MSHRPQQLLSLRQRIISREFNKPPPQYVNQAASISHGDIQRDAPILSSLSTKQCTLHLINHRVQPSNCYLAQVPCVCVRTLLRMHIHGVLLRVESKCYSRTWAIAVVACVSVVQSRRDISKLSRNITFHFPWETRP
jgi:hypothetical protein